MPRIARVVIPGVPHHVTQRGNDRQRVFFEDGDRALYLEILQRQSARFGLDVLAYCLMDNHVHLVATPRRADSLAKALGRAHFLYTLAVNRRRGRSGHLWQNRFFSCSLDGEHLWAALAYVELNPVRAGAVRRAWRYPWSSAAAHVGGPDTSGLLDLAAWRKMLAPGVDWKETLSAGLREEAVCDLRTSTRTGRPCGEESFVRRLEAALGRRLHALPGGRPRKTPGKARKHGDCP
jgi:putative transposase